jgi:DNA-binding transcriptional regulator YdaS (Cro superfamily)
MTVENRALQRAVELAGSRKDLAERIDVKVEDLEQWLGGKRRAPREVFLRVVDVILDELPPPDASS